MIKPISFSDSDRLEICFFIFDFMFISSFFFFISGGINHISNWSSGGFPTTSTGPSRSSTLWFEHLSSVFLVMIHVEAYMFTLHSSVNSHHTSDAAATGVKKTHRSIQVPGRRAAARWARNPSFSNTETYHGRKPADRSKTLPPSFSAWLRASTCMAAASPWGSNQSMESMIWHIHISHHVYPSSYRQRPLTTAIVKVAGLIRAMTSLISSVCMRRPENASGRESLACAFGLR